MHAGSEKFVYDALITFKITSRKNFHRIEIEIRKKKRNKVVWLLIKNRITASDFRPVKTGISEERAHRLNHGKQSTFRVITKRVHEAAGIKENEKAVSKANACKQQQLHSPHILCHDL